MLDRRQNGGGPGGFNGQSFDSTNNPFYSASTASVASVASIASVESVQSVQSAQSVESVASVQSAASVASVEATATTENAGSSIATSIGLGGSTTATLQSSSTASTAASRTASSTGSSTSTAPAAANTASTSSTQATTPTPSTLLTSPSSSGSSISAASEILHSSSGSSAQQSASSTPLPLTNAGHHGISSSTLAAAVVIPLLFALAALIGAFFCIRRKNRRILASQHHALASTSPSAGGFGFMPAMREKLGGTQTSAAPVMLGSNLRNNAYYTGLDTSSQASRGESGEYYAPLGSEARRSEGGTFADPPPPYKAKSLASSGKRISIPEEDEMVQVPLAAAAIPSVREPHQDASPFADPPVSSHARNESITSDTSTVRALPRNSLAEDTAFLASPIVAHRPGTSRSASRRSVFSAVSGRSGFSVDSDQYSDSASVHSAHAARRSVGGAQVITARASRGESMTLGNPFHDRHEEDAVSLVSNDEHDGGRRGSVVSELSFRRS
ncbi:hypothetical protein LTR97_012204 [Elasticomyces elasticus]|uniref:Uncharacterized protein n=1 Tax=Elasticomyces elasticus TaxID=574655 RepID=A0AAN7ZVB3_9PEZI|nr:hypothetical protein LTR97_012204 [Elasticomyces elasticus]